MANWRTRPPTNKEWMDANNHGYWWVKFIISEEKKDVDEDGNPIIWPETWYTDCVIIAEEITNGLLKDGRLMAEGNFLSRFYLDDPKVTEGLYWQPVASPLDDIKDQRPEVDDGI